MSSATASDEEGLLEEKGHHALPAVVQPQQEVTNLEQVLREYDRRLKRIESMYAQPPQELPEPRSGFSPQVVGQHFAESSQATATFAMRKEQSNSKMELVEEQELDGQHPFSRMWMNARLQKKEMFDQDLLQSIYEKSGQRARNRAAVLGGGLMGILSMPFGPIGMAAGALFGAVIGMLIGICLDRRRYFRNIQQSEIETRRLKSLVRWSAERFADEDDPLAAVQHLELVVLEFKPIADIATASKNARRTLKLLDSWAARRSMMRQLWAYMDNILINWKQLTQADFLRKMQVLQTLLIMYQCSSRLLAEPEENFIERVERLLENELVRFVMSQQQQLLVKKEGEIVMESMIFADARTGKRTRSKSQLRTEQDEDSDPDEMDVLSNCGARPGNWSSEMSRQSSGDSSERKTARSGEEQQRVLKAPFFKSWEDFMDFDNNYKHKIPITQSDFALLMEKESQGMQGWDMCVDRKEIKVAKTLQTDGGGCIFLRAWSWLPDVELPVVFHMFYKCEKRMEWDRAFFEMKVVDQIEGSDILYSVLRVPACTSRDYVQYRRVKVLEDGTILISLRSAIHPELPEKNGYIRAESFTSGYVMRRYDDGKEKGTKVFLMTCTDVKGIIPKWMINFVAPRKPGEWIDCLKKACLDYQAANPNISQLEKDLEPFKQNHPFDYEDVPTGHIEPNTDSMNMANTFNLQSKTYVSL
mmetsp:Transcript_15898/g.37567  ORF Transcript_15898/g.37567 Transcript_15898/m.37567 type:complete len:701 (-) Transcript_15898:208-2310(-)